MTVTIETYLNQTKYITEHLIKLLNRIEKDQIDIVHKLAVISEYKKTNHIFNEFAKQVRADGSEEEAFDFIIRGIENVKTAQSYELQVSQVQDVYNDALLIINNPLQSVAQAILQIGKQGISSRYGKSKTYCINQFTKENKTLPLKSNVSILDIIWEGRNQSIHFEDQKFNSSVIECFEELLRNEDQWCKMLSGYLSGENKAYEIIKILKWDTYKELENDLLALSI